MWLLLPFLSAARARDDVAYLELIANAVEHSESENIGMMFTAGVAEAAQELHWKVGSCAEALDAYAKSTPDMRAMMVTASFDRCSRMCPAGRGRKDVIAQLAHLGFDERTSFIVAACDAAGPETVFTGPWLDKRGQMDVIDYWVLRTAFELVFERVEEDPALRARYEAIRDGLAAQAVARFQAELQAMP